MRICQTWKSFPKIDALDISLLKCGKACIKENKDCSERTIKVNQFEHVIYIHKDKEKKRLKLLDKIMTPKELIDLLKLKLEKFAMHRFNVEHTVKLLKTLSTT